MSAGKNSLSLHSFILQIFMESLCIRLCLVGAYRHQKKKFFFFTILSVQEFAYLEVINMDEMAVGVLDRFPNIE